MPRLDIYPKFCDQLEFLPLIQTLPKLLHVGMLQNLFMKFMQDDINTHSKHKNLSAKDAGNHAK